MGDVRKRAAAGKAGGEETKARAASPSKEPRGPPPSRRETRDGDTRLLLVLAAVYLSLHLCARHFNQVPAPLPADAPEEVFSEGRALAHNAILTIDIGHRQASNALQMHGHECMAMHLVVSTAGEEAAAQYLLEQVQALAAQAAREREDLVVEAAREQVSGAVSMVAFKFDIANAYNNLTNVVLRIAPRRAAHARGVLVNSHYDSTLGTGGGRCRNQLLAETGVVCVCGFAERLGAFINLESTGPWGPDVLFQHTGDWTLAAYARAAPYPRGTTVAQDFFELGLIPADTVSVPGMGENVLPAIQEFARVLATNPATPHAGTKSGSVFFDLWAKAMIVYPHSLARFLHAGPLAVLLLLPLAARALGGAAAAPAPLGAGALLRGAGLAAASVGLALALPAAVGAARALLSDTPLVWYGRPALAHAIYLPASAAGLLLPYALAPALAPAPAKPGGRGAAALASPAVQGRTLGSALFFAACSALLTLAGMHSAFLFAAWVAATLAAAAAGAAARGRGFLAEAAAGLAPHAAAVGVCLPTCISVTQHVMEKVGLAGSAEGVVGLVAADAALGVVAGTAVYLFAGTLTATAAAALGRRRARRAVPLLLAAAAVAAAWGSLAHPQPYSYDHPKRLLAQHVEVEDAPYWSVVGLDSFPLARVLPPGVLQLPKADYSGQDWEALFPLNYLVTGLARAAPMPDLLPPGQLPSLVQAAARAPAPAPAGAAPGTAWERLPLRLDTVVAAWGVLNVSGPVGAWSLSDEVGAVPTPGGGWAHMVRYAGNLYARHWDFWLDVPQGAAVEIQARLRPQGRLALQGLWQSLFAKYLQETSAARHLAAQLPDWTSPALVTVYQSRWRFA
eukprot:scaffold1.g5787.t1